MSTNVSKIEFVYFKRIENFFWIYDIIHILNIRIDSQILPAGYLEEEMAKELSTKYGVSILIARKVIEMEQSDPNMTEAEQHQLRLSRIARLMPRKRRIEERIRD